MTHGKTYNKSKESKTRIAASFRLQEKHDVARDKSVLPENGNMEQECVTSMPATVCVPIQPICPGRKKDECHGRFRSPGDNYRASQDKIGNQLYTEKFDVAII